MGQNSEILGFKEKVNFLTSQKLAPFGPANGQSLTYSKIQTKVCRTLYSTQNTQTAIAQTLDIKKKQAS